MTSNRSEIKFGVPQGSILGPLLFIIYMNDIIKSSDLLAFLLVADDNTLCNSNSCFNDLIKSTNIELDKVSSWFSGNMLSLNVKKTKFMMFGTNLSPNLILVSF